MLRRNVGDVCLRECSFTQPPVISLPIIVGFSKRNDKSILQGYDIEQESQLLNIMIQKLAPPSRILGLNGENIDVEASFRNLNASD